MAINTKHALLSPSGSKRWLACTPSARLSEKVPRAQSSYAGEGHKAHELAETLIYSELGTSTPKLQLAGDLDDYPPEMIEAAQEFTRIVMDCYNSYDPGTVTIYVEWSVRFDAYVPGGKGTADVVIVTPDTIHVFDFKYGSGVLISAMNNSQLGLYALGTVLELRKIFGSSDKVVHMHIVQPQRDNLSTYKTTAESLIRWAAEFVAPRAKMANEGSGEFVTGDHCQFCNASPRCPAYGKMFNDMNLQTSEAPEMLGDGMLLEVLKRADLMRTWLNKVKEYAQERAVKGDHFEGFKLVESTKRKVWTDPAKLAQQLQDLGYPDDIIMEQKLKSYTALKRAIGKQDRPFLEGQRTQPQGVPILVPVDDKRQAWSPLSAKDVFTDSGEKE